MKFIIWLITVLRVAAVLYAEPILPGLERVDTGCFQQEKSDDRAEESELKNWMGRMHFSGTIQAESRLSWGAIADQSRHSSSSDLYLRKTEVAIEAEFIEWFSAITVLNTEWIGDSQKQGDSHLMIDEAHLDVRIPRTPFFLIFGKRFQGFGRFANGLITDPLTQDAYETKKVGLTAGISGPFGSKATFTLYKGSETLDHFFQSELFEAQSISRAPLASNHSDSMIFNISASSPTDLLQLSAALSSEPGAGRRNVTLNVGFHFEPPFMKNIVLDGDFMKALQRETYFGFPSVFKESIFSFSGAYSFVLRKLPLNEGPNYKQRRAEIITYPIQVSARYERFDDDGMTEIASVWTVKHRLSFGGRYSFFGKGKTMTYGELEFRRSEYRLPMDVPNLQRKKNSNEIYFRLGIDF